MTGDEGRKDETANPTGADHIFPGPVMLSLKPSARKPVMSIIISIRRGKRLFSGPRSSLDISLPIKNIITAARKIRPVISSKRESTDAERSGSVRHVWANIITATGSTHPQNAVRCRAPRKGFFNIFLCPRMYLRRNHRSPGHLSGKAY
jgi:hypothetical protein